MAITNVVFDVGNVLVRWAPYEAIQMVFPEQDPKAFYQQLRPIWLDLNLGKLSEEEAINTCVKQLQMPEEKIKLLMHKFKTLQTPIPGSMELLQELKAIGINLYSITDNVKEIMKFHATHSKFIHYFKGIVVSADVGVLKPDIKIYRYLLNNYNINPTQSVFIDDLLDNVEGARTAGMHAFQFIDANSCRKTLVGLGLSLS